MTPRQARALRLGLVAVLFGGLVLVGRLTGVTSKITLDRLREATVAAGGWGALLYVAIFSAGQLVHMPGLIFIAAGLLAYGKVWGALLAWVGALVSLSVTFVVVRAAGGHALSEVESPMLQRLLAQVDRHPLRTVFVLRVLFTTSPVVNYALALCRLRYRDYLLGSALALGPFVVLAALVLDRVLAWIGA
jgi:uncharacterized membrane protein YdjX (TVP38/TMEM64 family)